MPRLPFLITAAVYILVCMGLWGVPVLGLLHAESSAVIAGVGFFASGVAALAIFRRGLGLGRVMLGMQGLLLIPLALLSLSLLWRENCGYLQGLLLYGVLAPPSVALGVTLAYVLDAAALRFRALLFGVIGVVVGVVPVLYDLGLHPQFYTYNHVWGGVLGPIYDEELAVRPGLFFFRGLTLWWAVWLVVVGRRARLRRSAEGGGGSRESRRLAGVLLVVTLLIAGTYAAAPWLGINTPGWVIQQRLGGHLELDRFDIYYDPEDVSEAELAVIADVHRYRYARLREELGAGVPVRIATYLYPDAETKAALTGARETSVAPTWLPTPQIHMLRDRFEASFAHELAHVVAREFGMPVLRASRAVGLVEGLAVAVEPPDGLPTPHAQVAAALRHREALGVYGDSLAAGVARQLTPLGFWTGRGAVNYVTMGSFVRYLLDAYGAEPLREAYSTGNMERAFGKPVEALAREWERFVHDQPEDPEALALVQARFTRPSLFEQPCPHYVPPLIRHLRAGARALDAGDGEAAAAAYEAALAADSTSTTALVAWARLALARGDTAAARSQLEAAAASRPGASLLARLGDARRIAGADVAADSAYAQALRRVPSYAHETRAALQIRRALPAEAVLALLSPDPPAERARRLEAMPGAAPLMAALLYGEAGDARRAFAAMERPRERVLPEVTAERLAWQAAFAHAAGDRARASTFAEEAAREYDNRGAVAAAERQRDRVSLLQWHLLRE